MGLTSLFITALIIGFSGAMMPGPLLTATINESYYKGFQAGPRLIIGHGILEITLVIGLIMGLSSFLILESVKIGLFILGGFFLLWMGWGMVKNTVQSKVKLELAATGPTKSMPPEVIGVLTSISNPYWTLWWATIGLGYLTLSYQHGILGLTAFYLGHISSDFLWYSGIAFAVTSGKKLISDKIYRMILFLCGLFLIGLAAYFMYSGVHLLANV